VSFFRSTLLGVIVSLVLCTGYADDLVGACCPHDHHMETDDHGSRGSGDSDACQCICHQAISVCTVQAIRVAAVVVKASGFLPEANEFPPDAIPLGIDHPPQIA
jgi:hypothetical protein